MELGAKIPEYNQSAVELRPVYPRAYRGLTIAAFGLAGAGIGAFSGAVGGLAEFETTSMQEQQDQVVIAETEYQEVQQTLERFPIAPAGVSETCVTVLYDYIAGTLADTSEDTAVADVLAEESQPCGDTPREVRSAYILSFEHAGQYFQLLQAADSAEAHISDEQADVAALKRDLAHNAVNELPKWTGPAGWLLGIMRGRKSGRLKDQNKTNERFHDVLNEGLSDEQKRHVNTWPMGKKQAVFDTVDSQAYYGGQPYFSERLTAHVVSTIQIDAETLQTASSGEASGNK